MRSRGHIDDLIWDPLETPNGSGSKHEADAIACEYELTVPLIPPRRSMQCGLKGTGKRRLVRRAALCCGVELVWHIGVVRDDGHDEAVIVAARQPAHHQLISLSALFGQRDGVIAVDLQGLPIDGARHQLPSPGGKGPAA